MVIIVAMSLNLEEKSAHHAVPTLKKTTLGLLIHVLLRTRVKRKNMAEEADLRRLQRERERDKRMLFAKIDHAESEEIQRQEEVDARRKDTAQDLDMNS